MIASTPTSSMVLSCGTKIWPDWVSEVRRTSRRGSRPSWMACWVSEKAPVITAWLAMTVAAPASSTSGRRRALGAISKNQLSSGNGTPALAAASQHQGEGALAQIVQGQAGQDEEQPGGLDRPAAEVAHVGRQGLGPGHRQEHRAQHDEAGEAVMHQEASPRSAG
jgi:hypothetical protein